jgi:hypothetical protein
MVGINGLTSHSTRPLAALAHSLRERRVTSTVGRPCLDLHRATCQIPEDGLGRANNFESPPHGAPVASDDGWSQLLGFAAALVLGYAVVKALTERPCPSCARPTPKRDPSCKYCGAWIGVAGGR